MTAGSAQLAGGRYVLVRRIGRGASGEVWLAEDTRLGRQVAIKRADIPEYLGEAERQRIRRRLEREARAAARLRQHGVAQLFDVHVSDDSVDLVMAYIDAPTLHQLVADDGPLPDEDVARMGLTILAVLEEAHGQGVVHRDIKPSNVLVADDGVRVTDFGIAAILDETALTRTGMALGSPSFIAPEQAKGDEPAPEADLWGLGATLYYALTGRPPFDRQRALATVHAVVHEPHDPIGGDHPLAPLVDRLLAKDPAARPSMREIRATLEDVASGRAAGASATQVLPPVLPPARAEDTVVARPAPPPRDEPPATPAPDPEPRSRWARPLLVAAGLLLLGLVGVLWLTGGDPSTQPPVAGDDGGAAVEQGDDAGAAPAEDAPADAAEEPADAPRDDAGEGDTATDDAPATDEAPETDDAPEVTPAVPEGWEVYEGETYTVAHPPGWEPRPASGVRVDLVDPESGAYLRLDWTDSPHPDPVADWQEKSDGFAARHDDYREIRIEEVDYHDAAALWEYTYRDGGARLHAYNLGFVAGDRGYALNLQSRASDWDDVEPLFDDIMRSFRPAG